MVIVQTFTSRDGFGVVNVDPLRRQGQAGLAAFQNGANEGDGGIVPAGEMRKDFAHRPKRVYLAVFIKFIEVGEHHRA